MINVSTAFRKKLYNDERDYINSLRFTLTDGTVLNVGHEHIMSNGVEVDDAVGDDSKFNALGAAICNSLTVILYNNDEIYSDYVFEGATCVYTTGLEVDNDGTLVPENLDMGVYTVDSASYSDYTITLTLLDNMEQFDRPYNSLLSYPATLLEIVRDACTNCGVSLSTTSLRFPHDDYVAPVRPNSTDTTYREVLGWCATIAGCFAKCDRQGDLVFRWFDTNALENTDNDFDGGIFDSANPYATGDAVDGGLFNPWNTGDDAVADEFTVPIPYHYITELSTQNIGVDDTVISGVSITVKIDGDGTSQDTQVFVEGTSEFMIQITDNPFITADTAEDVLDWLSTQLIGLRFRQCNVSHPNDPTIEAGDVGVIWDKKGDQHNVLITRVTFSPMAYQTVVCGVETPSKNQSARVTESTKAYVETRKQLKEQKNVYDLAMEELQEEIENSNGLYFTEEVQQDQSVKYYLHERPSLANSNIRIEFSTAGVTVTPDRGQHTYGLTVTGQFLASVIQTISLFFDYASGGTLTLGGANNGNGTLRVLDANGNQIGHISNTGASLSGNIVMKSSNGQAEFTTFNHLYLNDFYNTLQQAYNGYGLQLTGINGVKYQIAIATPSNQDVSVPKRVTEVIECEGTYNKVVKMRTTGYGLVLSTIYSGTPTYKGVITTGGIQIVPFAEDGATLPSNILNINDAAIRIATANRIFDISSIRISPTNYSISDYDIHNRILINDSDNTNLPRLLIERYVRSKSYTTPYERVVVDTFWRVLLATPDDEVYLDLYKTDSNYNFIRLKAGTCGINIGSSTSGSYVTNEFLLTNGKTGASQRELSGDSNNLSWNGNTLAYASSSSKRYKHDIANLQDENLDPHKLLELSVKQFIYNDDDATLQYKDMKGQLLPGFIAEEMAEIYPSAVIRKNGEVESWDERRIIPGMLALIQEQHKKIEEQEEKIQSLEERLAKLETFIKNLADDGR